MRGVKQPASPDGSTMLNKDRVGAELITEQGERLALEQR